MTRHTIAARGTLNEVANVFLTRKGDWAYEFIIDGVFHSDWRFVSSQNAERAARKAIRKARGR